MKNLILFFLIILSTWIRAEQPELVPYFKIISDSIDTNVPDGKCLITGKVLYNGLPISNTAVYSKNHKAEYSNKEGFFRILIDTTDLYLIAHRNGYSDSYVEYYKFQSGHKIELEIYMQDEVQIMVEKPVIYCYDMRPNRNQLTLTLKNTNIEFSYPQIINKEWTFQTDMDGIIYTNERVYPYLFYEGKLNPERIVKKSKNKFEGVIINTDSTIKYLEYQLEQLGLNAKETTDFITYWGPRLQSKKYAFIQWLVDEEYDSVSELQLSEKKYNQRRVYLNFSSFDQYPNIELSAPAITHKTLKRDGITIIEWGGGEIENHFFKLKI